MTKYCLEKWDKNKDRLEQALKKEKNRQSNRYDYKKLIKMVVVHILNEKDGGFSNEKKWDAEKITEIDNGGYSGTLLYLVPKNMYQPSEYDYLMTYVGYGSCSGCDTLQRIIDYDNEETYTETQIKDLMSLCRDIVCNIVKPYNCGWRNEKEFEFTDEVGK